MWYFTWILGVAFASGFGVLNAVWHEHYLPNEDIYDGTELRPGGPPAGNAPGLTPLKAKSRTGMRRARNKPS